MSDSKLVNVYDSRTAAYQHAFQVFLDNTDQKAKAREWLDRLVQELPSRQVFIDAGAGNGKVTAWFADKFRQTIAIEPNPYLCNELRRTCPTAEVLPDTILEARPSAAGNLVLCSHVFYYLPHPDWMLYLEKLVSWLAPDGVLVIILQNHRTDCARMQDHFFGQRFNLSELANTFHASKGERYRIELETVPAKVATADFDSAYTVAEFMLNLLPVPQPPSRLDVEEYVREHFRDSAEGYGFSCDQDFLRIQPRS